MRFVLLSLVLPFLFACSSTIHSYGDKTSNSAVLRGPYHVDVTAIDEKFPSNRPDCTGPVCTKGFEIHLQKGAHSIDVALATGNASSNTVRLAFYAEANGVYEFRHSETADVVINEDGTWKPVIIDTKNNRVISYYKDVLAL